MTDSATRAAMVTRTEAKKAKHREANDARAEANYQRLIALGGMRQNYMRVTTYLVTLPSGGHELRERSRSKLESPGTALARTLRERRA